MSVCKICCVSTSIITFIGNCAEGSSGSPILDEFGKVIGVSFGCYEDETEVDRDPGTGVFLKIKKREDNSTP